MPCWQWAQLISDDAHTFKNLSWDWLKVPLTESNNKEAQNKQQMHSFLFLPLNNYSTKKYFKKKDQG